jgi:phospholipid/cholesterol/gamma-HCH transport system substrate-binding protein
LFNGFRPLFSALTPDQVNELSQDIIDVLQGQTDRLDALISQTADLTANLADRSQTFSEVLDSLSQLLGTIAKHDDELANIVTTVHDLTQALHADGPAILDSIDSVDQLTGSVAGLLGNLENHNLPGDVADAASITGALARNTGRLQQLVTGFVSAFGTFARVSQNGNWINIYPCRAHVRTFGTVTISGKQGIDALLGLLNSPTGKGVAGNLGTTASGLLNGLGLGGLLGGAVLPVPLQLPNGQVGDPSAQTAVCK